MKLNAKAFATIEAILIVVILAILGGTGYYVYHAKKVANDTLSSAAKDASGSPKYAAKKAAATDFASCKSAPGSVMQETYPEKCVTKDGKSFTDTSQATQTSYLAISEWNVKLMIPASQATDMFYYKIDASDSQTANIYATAAKSIVGPTGKNCGDEYVAFIYRVANDDPSLKQQGTDAFDPSAPHQVIGSYTYYPSAQKNYGPSCFAQTNSSNDYQEDDATAAKFAQLRTDISKDLDTIQSIN